MASEEEEILSWEAEYLERKLEEARTWGIPARPRMCLNCGKTWPADKPRTEANCEPPPGLAEDLKDLIPCITDMTYSEAMDTIRNMKAQITALNRALRDARRTTDDGTTGHQD